MQTLPQHAQVVIVGGGIIGCSVAYHLTQLGWTDVVLLERKTLTCGTTWHSGAVIGQLRPSFNMTRLAQYTGQLLANLEAETGQATGYKQSGALVVTAGNERFEELQRSASMGRCFGLEVEVISPREAQSLWPLLNIDDLVGAVYLPTEGQTNPTDTTLSLAKGARLKGAKFFENTPICGIETRNARVHGVRTEHQLIECEYAVNCTGMWARDIGLETGVHIPVQAVEHMYVVTEPMPELTPDLPSLRDHNQCIYFRVDAQQMLIGINEPGAKVWGLDGIPPDFAFEQLPEDWDHFEPYMENALQRVPALANAGIKLFLSGPESMTPDTRYLLGETPGLSNHFVAAGFSGVGVGSSGGAGKALAEWIVDGQPSMDLWGVDIQRMMPFQTNRRYLAERVQESNGLLYDMHWPFRQHESARNVRQSAIHGELAKQGACFGEVAGWERPNWFAPRGMRPRYEYSYGRQNWFEPSACEHRCVREAVGLYDISADAKLMVEGEDATPFLSRICVQSIDTPGKIVTTPWLNEGGGTVALVRVIRYSRERYLVLSDPQTIVRNQEWLRRQKTEAENVSIEDTTSNFALMAIAGPNAGYLLANLLEHDAKLPAPGQSAEFAAGYGSVRLSRLLDVGEPSYQLLVSTEFARGLFNQIQAIGGEHGLSFIGVHAWRSLLMEKGRHVWGETVSDGETPYQAGLLTTLDGIRHEFVGRAALESQMATAINAKPLSFLLLDPQPQLYYNEPVLRAGRIVGHLLSGMYGHSVGGAIGLGYVSSEGFNHNELIEASYEVEIAGRRFAARATPTAFYDPDGRREVV